MGFDARLKACKEIFELILESYKLDKDLTEDINSFIEKYKDSYNESIWPLISTAFLMTQEFISSEETYSFLNENSDNLIESFDELSQFSDILYLDEYSNNIVLFKEFLNDLSPYENYSFFKDGAVDENKCDYYLNNSELSKEEIEDFFISNNYILNGEVIKDFEKEFKDIIKQLYKTKYGYNSEFVLNDFDVDVIKLVVCIRNALAHSNYEVLNNNKIRIYNLNKKYNFIIDKKLVLLVINEISEYHYEFGKKLDPYDIPEEYLDTSKMRFEMLPDLLNKLGISGMSEVKLAREFKRKYGKELYDLSFKEGYELLINLLIEKYNSSIYYGKIINEYLYSNNGEDYTDELYDRCSEYKYFNYDNPIDDFDNDITDEKYYKMRYSYSSDENKESRLKFYLLTLINSYYHSAYNTLDNMQEKEKMISLDFGFMNLNDELRKIINKSIKDELFLPVNNKHKVSSKIADLRKNLKNQKNNLEKVNDEKIKTIILNNIKGIEEKLVNLYHENDEILKKERSIQAEYDENKDLYFSYQILKYIRHALSHGDVYFEKPFDFNDIGNNIIVFESYDTKYGSENRKTFSASCRVSDLLKSIIDIDNIKTLMNIEKENVKVKKI